ncbi:MAG: dihydroorotase [Chitinophagaceae bacterium]
MSNYIIKNTIIVNEGKQIQGDVLIQQGRIQKIAPQIETPAGVKEIDGTGQYLIPGAIDDQVHFREPGLTHKANIYTEAKAAVAGGVTSFMEMPNTQPPVFTQELLEDKYAIGAQNALANYSFFMGTSQDNWEEVLKTNAKKNEVCGVKIFMGSSTGNLLVDNPIVLERIFEGSELLIATHCEEESIIKKNKAALEAIKPILEPSDHPVVRNEEVCFESSFKAIQLAKKFDTRLHILHISTAKELQLFSNLRTLAEKRITAEVCVHHLHFTSNDYAALGNLIKCNPAIKAPHHRDALWEGLLNDQLDVIATDHAPHTWAEKQEDYPHAHAGLPLVQHPVMLMLKYVKEGKLSIEKMVEKMSHAVATCFQIKDRGFIREGYWADLVLVKEAPHIVTKESLLYKCGWSPLEGTHFPYQISSTFVNGVLVYHQGQFDESQKGHRLQFNRG